MVEDDSAVRDLFVVVVMYQRRIEASSTCASLLNQEGIVPPGTILLYENSTSDGVFGIPEGWQLQQDKENGGLVRAYNQATSLAKARGAKWLLLLDQDTMLPANFLAAMASRLRQVQLLTKVVAVVPIVKVDDRQVSPMIPGIFGNTVCAKRDAVVSDWLMAINSGTCVRIDFIDDIGGFNDDFWLDYLDHWLFKTIRDKRQSVYICDVYLKHDLSVVHMNRGVSVERYRNVLEAELRFTNGYLPYVWRVALVPRLLLRAAKHLCVTSDKRLGFTMAVAAVTQLGLLVGLRQVLPRINSSR